MHIIKCNFNIEVKYNDVSVLHEILHIGLAPKKELQCNIANKTNANVEAKNQITVTSNFKLLLR